MKTDTSTLIVDETWIKFAIHLVSWIASHRTCFLTVCKTCSCCWTSRQTDGQTDGWINNNTQTRLFWPVISANTMHSVLISNECKFWPVLSRHYIISFSVQTIAVLHCIQLFYSCSVLWNQVGWHAIWWCSSAILQQLDIPFSWSLPLRDL